jgi:hypothetical protein
VLWGNDAAVALAAAVVVTAAAGFTKAETERIWLLLVPQACVARRPPSRHGGSAL